MPTQRTSRITRTNHIRKAERTAMCVAFAVSVAAFGASAPAVAQTCQPTWDPGAGPNIGDPGVSGVVWTTTVFDDGAGPALYAGGDFTYAGGVLVNNIAKWDGSSWSPLGSGANNTVFALTVFDDGTGPALYAGGNFTIAGGVPANFIAKWDGSSWSPLGIGVNSQVYALTVFDDGTGPALYAGGVFTTAGGVIVNGIAKWNGSFWSALGSGVNATVISLAVFDDGTGPALYAGGSFTFSFASESSMFVDGVTVNHIAEWDGSSWSPLGSGVNSTVFALTVFDDGTGPALYAGGVFTSAGGFPASRIAQYSGCLTTVPADLNGDGVVDGADLATLLTQWGTNGSADLNGDGTVDGADLAQLLTNWGPV